MSKSVLSPAFVVSTYLAVCVGCNTEGLHRGRSPKGEIVAVPQTLAPRTVDEPYLLSLRESDIVEDLIASRQAYVESLRELEAAYAKTNDARRAWAAHELKGMNGIQTFSYLLDAEIPPADLRPSQSIVAADQLYEQGRKLMREGGHGVPALFRRDKMTAALQAFKTLIARYPTSDKIDDAAFYCGEIHKEYFPEQELIAVQWYERAMQWNPKTPHPVRFQAAVIYDYRLHDRARALELYHGVLDHESELSGSNRRFAARRIDELTRERGTSRRPGSSPSPTDAALSQPSQASADSTDSP